MLRLGVDLRSVLVSELVDFRYYNQKKCFRLNTCIYIHFFQKSNCSSLYLGKRREVYLLEKLYQESFWFENTKNSKRKVEGKEWKTGGLTKSFKYWMVKAPRPLCCHAIRILAGRLLPAPPCKTKAYISLRAYWLVQEGSI